MELQHTPLVVALSLPHTLRPAPLPSLRQSPAPRRVASHTRLHLQLRPLQSSLPIRTRRLHALVRTTDQSCDNCLCTDCLIVTYSTTTSGTSTITFAVTATNTITVTAISTSTPASAEATTVAPAGTSSLPPYPQGTGSSGPSPVGPTVASSGLRPSSRASSTPSSRVPIQANSASMVKTGTAGVLAAFIAALVLI